MTATVETSRRPPLVLDLHGAFLRRADLSNANLERANFTGADFTQASFRGANFKDANLEKTILIGADLTDAKNLTVKQLRQAVLDETTKLPAYLSFREIKSAA